MQLFEYSFTAMGGPCQLSIWGNVKPIELFALAEQEVCRLEAKYSRYLPNSVLSQINSHTECWHKIDDETQSLLDYAATCFEQSEGLFDITSGVLRQVWDFKQAKLPSQTQIRQCLNFVGFERLQRRFGQIYLPASMQIDFGGIVKEYAADRVLALINQVQQDASVLVNLAGDIAVSQSQPDNDPWTIGVRHPEIAHSMANLPLSKGGLATSGDYERCFYVGDQKYSHLLNPKTGWPIESTYSSVTVVAAQTIVAGSAATIAMLSADQAPAWLDQLGLPYLLIDQQGRTISNALDKNINF